MEWIQSGKTSDKGFGLMIRNRIPLRTLKFDSGIGILLGEGGSVVSTKKGVAAEESVGDDGCAERMNLCSFVRVEK